MCNNKRVEISRKKRGIFAMRLFFAVADLDDDAKGTTNGDDNNNVLSHAAQQRREKGIWL